MHRKLFTGPALGAALLASLAAMPASAQKVITAGQTVSGQIDADDPKLDDDSHYEIWTYRGRAGERLTITLRSGDFDAYLAFGRLNGGECEDACETDDDGAGGTDSRVVVTIEEDGVYQIRANTLAGGETGAYTLSVESGQAVVAQARPITLGRAVNGSLEESDPQAGDDSYYELWRFQGRAGQRIVVTMRSTDFDAYLAWGKGDGDDWEEVDSDDDGAGGTDARLEITLGDDGVAVIRANTLAGGETGAYTLIVESAS